MDTNKEIEKNPQVNHDGKIKFYQDNQIFLSGCSQDFQKHFNLDVSICKPISHTNKESKLIQSQT